MASVPTGTAFYIASAFAASKPTASVSNAAEAVVGIVGHGYVDGDILEVSSGWGRLHLRPFRVKNATADTFKLEGCDTTNTQFFPPGTGVGSVRKVSAFTQITQVLGVSSSGGDPKTVDYKYIESDVNQSINDGFSATSYQLDIDADSISTPGYAALKSLTDVQTNTIMKMVVRSGAIVLQGCTVALNEAPSVQDAQVMKVKASFNGTSKLVRYAS
ncbi:MAG: phage tail protein [Aquabacterium sp.]|uniref:phage tail tube protein n=1 Tax=Aquabacterium sp. TaxID=1872578 RepID=UPI0011FA3B6D|nr:phage tail tube protein [Aquabacterium sp.]TAK84512.1 MAG: phage tail protein [Aquabacterium sp.]